MAGIPILIFATFLIYYGLFKDIIDYLSIFERILAPVIKFTGLGRFLANIPASVLKGLFNLFFLFILMIIFFSAVVFVYKNQSKKQRKTAKKNEFQLKKEVIEEEINKLLPKILITSKNKNSKIFCSHYLYGWKRIENSVEAYIWAYCEEHFVKNGKVEMGEGISEPVKIVFDLKDGKLKFSSYMEPKEGSNYVPSIKEMFPENFAKLAINNQPDPKPLIEEVQKKVKNYFY